MAEGSKIQWTGGTWNPLVGCTICSPGCRRCYAMREAWRLMHNPHPAIAAKFAGTARLADGKPVWTGKINFDEKALLAPLRRRKPQVYFVNSLSDLFHEDVPDEWIDQIFAVMAMCPQHVFQVLTKRADRMRDYVSAQVQGARHVTDWIDRWEQEGRIKPFGVRRFIGKTLPNVWLGVSVEDQKRAWERIPALLETPAAVRFLSCEPLIGPVDLLPWFDPTGACCGGEEGASQCRNCPASAEWRYVNADEHGLNQPELHWVIAGGESGPGARPMHPDWARSLRDQCGEAGVPFFFKQWGAHAPLESARPTIEGFAAWPDGTVGKGTASRRGGRGIVLFHGVKRVTGRHLDGTTHDAMPECCRG